MAANAHDPVEVCTSGISYARSVVVTHAAIVAGSRRIGQSIPGGHVGPGGRLSRRTASTCLPAATEGLARATATAAAQLASSPASGPQSTVKDPLDDGVGDAVALAGGLEVATSAGLGRGVEQLATAPAAMSEIQSTRRIFETLDGRGLVIGSRL